MNITVSSENTRESLEQHHGKSSEQHLGVLEQCFGTESRKIKENPSGKTLGKFPDTIMLMYSTKLKSY